MNWNNAEIRRLLQLALAEDHARQDVTSATVVNSGLRAGGEIRAKQRGVVAGLPLAKRFFKALDRRCDFQSLVKEGAQVQSEKILARITGNARALLSAERPALNALQHLSGIATVTAQAMSRMRSKKVRLLDTRKTIPGWRALEKYAVRCGGGTNHRVSLADAVLIKDNHLKLAALAGIDWASRIRTLRRTRPGMSVQIEVQTSKHLREVLALKPPLVLLDNLPVPKLRKMIKLLRREIPGVEIELSGGVRMEDLPVLSRLDVDRISMGRLTHSAPAFDCSFEITDVYPR